MIIYETDFGKYEITDIVKCKYRYGDNLAIQLFYHDDELDENLPFTTLTVNIDGYDLADDEAFVDTNNNPDAEEFIKKYNLGELTGMYGESGWCEYPLYKFDLSKMEEPKEEY